MRHLLLAGVLTAALLTACTPAARQPEASPAVTTPAVTTPAASATIAPSPTPPRTTTQAPTLSPVSPTLTPLPTQQPTVPSLQQSFAAFAAKERGQLSVAFAPVGSTEDPTVLGDLGSPVAWSTSKVPVAIAVEGTPQGPGLRPTMRQAITASNNEAAVRLWQSLGQPAAAAEATDAVLRDFGDPTTQTQSQQVRPPYTAFGQTRWTVGDQARFAAQLPCRSEAEQVYVAMGQIIASQRWGLGRVPDAHFKGGWGPSSAGYLVRQLGVIDTAEGQVAVAVAVEAASFEAGTATLTRTAHWISQHAAQLPAGEC